MKLFVFHFSFFVDSVLNQAALALGAFDGAPENPERNGKQDGEKNQQGEKRRFNLG